MMEDGLYEELERVFAKISEHGERGDQVPIAELYFCYTVGPVIQKALHAFVDLRHIGRYNLSLFVRQKSGSDFGSRFHRAR